LLDHGQSLLSDFYFWPLFRPLTPIPMCIAPYIH
jgi:hypothetical protein